MTLAPNSAPVSPNINLAFRIADAARDLRCEEEAEGERADAAEEHQQHDDGAAELVELAAAAPRDRPTVSKALVTSKAGPMNSP